MSFKKYSRALIHVRSFEALCQRTKQCADCTRNPSNTEGYEPKRSLKDLRCAMESSEHASTGSGRTMKSAREDPVGTLAIEDRGRSLQPAGSKQNRTESAPVQRALTVNPFWSGKAQGEATLRSLRPMELPPHEEPTSSRIPRASSWIGDGQMDIRELVKMVFQQNTQLKRELEELRGHVTGTGSEEQGLGGGTQARKGPKALENQQSKDGQALLGIEDSSGVLALHQAFEEAQESQVNTYPEPQVITETLLGPLHHGDGGGQGMVARDATTAGVGGDGVLGGHHQHHGGVGGLAQKGSNGMVGSGVDGGLSLDQKLARWLAWTSSGRGESSSRPDMPPNSNGVAPAQRLVESTTTSSPMPVNGSGVIGTMASPNGRPVSFGPTSSPMTSHGAPVASMENGTTPGTMSSAHGAAMNGPGVNGGLNGTSTSPMTSMHGAGVSLGGGSAGGHGQGVASPPRSSHGVDLLGLGYGTSPMPMPTWSGTNGQGGSTNGNGSCWRNYAWLQWRSWWSSIWTWNYAWLQWRSWWSSVWTWKPAWLQWRS